MIKQTVYDIIEIAKQTKEPFLLLSNPGYGKTTSIKAYADEHNMHLETVIGSQSSPEEILGYSVNSGEDYLKDLNPKWFKRLAEASKSGKRPLLFLDEISTCNGAVLGALLSLIFDRRLKSGDMLPEDTVIIAAANYAKNLPQYMDLLAPTINRFVIYNFTAGMTGLTLCDELFGKVPEIENRKYQALSDKNAADFEELFEQLYRKMFTQYSDPDSNQGYLDINNTDLSGVYQDAENHLYNFISLRSLKYFKDNIKACIELGIKDKSFIEKITDGLIGGGTNNFRNDLQRTNFCNLVNSSVMTIINKLHHNEDLLKKSKDFNYGSNISSKVAAFMTESEAITSFIGEGSDKANEIFDSIIEDVEKKKDVLTEIVKFDKNVEAQGEFVSNYQSICELAEHCEKIGIDYEKLIIYLQNYFAYYSQLTGHSKLPDLNRQEVFTKHKSSMYRCSLVAVKSGEEVTSKNAVFVGVTKVKTGPLMKLPYGLSIYSCMCGSPLDDTYNVAVFDHGELKLIKPSLLLK